MDREWAQRFYENLLDPKQMGFDHIVSGNRNTRKKDTKAPNLALNLGDRMDELKDRIKNHYASTNITQSLITWNKNPQCPPDIWKKISVSLVPTSKKTFKGLAVQRHSKVKSTLDNMNHIELSFSINNYIDLGYGFWLIDDQYKDFVYAILKSSMFSAWCELTAADEGEQEGHFSTGMWDTFLLPKLTESQESAIIIAGQKLRKKWPGAQGELDKLVDELFVPALRPQFLTNVDRRQILGERFLKMFSSLKIDVMSLAILPKPRLISKS